MVIPEYIYIALAVAIVILAFLFGITAVINATKKEDGGCKCKDCEYLENWAWVSEKEKVKVLCILDTTENDPTDKAEAPEGM